MWGRVVWLSAPDNHIKPHIPFPPVLDPQRHYETRALYYVNGEILYFNPTLNACNGNTTLEREWLADLKIEISHQNLQVIWRSSVSGFNSSQNPSRDRRFKDFGIYSLNISQDIRNRFSRANPHSKSLMRVTKKLPHFGVSKTEAEEGHRSAWPKWCEFLDEHQPTLADKSLVFFLTSTGMVGCASHTVQVGDLVCAIEGGQERLAFVSQEKSKSKQGARITGKGLELTSYAAMEWFSDEERTTVVPDHLIKLQVDTAAMLYLTGYFQAQEESYPVITLVPGL
jgi:hypothetical protein